MPENMMTKKSLFFLFFIFYVSCLFGQTPIIIHVFDEDNGEVLQEVDIYIIGPSNQKAEVTKQTDRNGSINITVPFNGGDRIDIIAVKAGFQRQATKHILANDGNENRLDIRLREVIRPQIEGILLDKEGEFVQGAKVILKNTQNDKADTTYTDDNGYFIIRPARTRKNHIMKLQIQKERYETKNINSLWKNLKDSVQFVLEKDISQFKKAFINEVVVNNKKNKPIHKAKITITTDSLTYIDSTDIEGEFRIKLKTTDIVNITIEKEGFESYDKFLNYSDFPYTFKLEKKTIRWDDVKIIAGSTSSTIGIISGIAYFHFKKKAKDPTNEDWMLHLEKANNRRLGGYIAGGVGIGVLVCGIIMKREKKKKFISVGSIEPHILFDNYSTQFGVLYRF